MCFLIDDVNRMLELKLTSVHVFISGKCYNKGRWHRELVCPVFTVDARAKTDIVVCVYMRCMSGMAS